jgi:transposase
VARDRRELTDAQWARLAPLLPPVKPARGRPTRELRLLVEGIIFWMRAGLPWRDLPAEFGRWPTVANCFYRWTRAGVWDRLLARLQADADARGELDWLLHFIDSSTVRAHQHAAGAKGGMRRPRGSAARVEQDGEGVAEPRAKQALRRDHGSCAQTRLIVKRSAS